MVKYRTRPGVVLTDICGENVLVSASSLAGLCPYVTQINDSSVFLWKLLVHPGEHLSAGNMVAIHHAADAYLHGGGDYDDAIHETGDS